MFIKPSVVIPAYNAESVIQHCLDALERQSIDRTKFEVIVVDDGSTDNTAAIVSANNSCKLIRQDNQGPAAARNRGANEAQGNVVIFIDADCEPSSSWLDEMLKPFEKEDNLTAVKGAYKTRQTSLISRFTQIEFEYKYTKLVKHEYVDFIDSYSAAFKKDVFLKMEGFDTSFPTACAEDADFSFKLAKSGYKIRFNPKAIVYHTHPFKLGDYLKRKYTYISWRPVTIKRYPGHALNDSYAPFSFKMQIILAPITLLTFMLFLLDSGFGTIFAATSIGFVAVTIPFIIWTLKFDWKVAIVSLPILLLRGIAQSLGLGVGFIRLFLSKST